MRLYLDNNSTTPLDPEVVEAMIQELKAPPHNPSSIHFYGQEAKKILSKSREEIANFMEVKPKEIIFTSGGTEGMNLLIKGALGQRGGEVIGAAIDHASTYQTLLALDKCSLTFLPVGAEGAPSPEALERAMTPRTKLIVLSAANSETGVKLDLEAMAMIAERAGIPLLIDGVALLGKEPLKLPQGVLGAVFSAHKFHGPKGVGFVVARSSLKLDPLLAGGGQERGLRSGTENLPGIVGMTKALMLIDAERNERHLKSLRDHFEHLLRSKVPDIEINGSGPRLPNTSNLYFPGCDGESLLIALDMRGIAASHASACASGALEPSRALLKMGYSYERARGSLRFSFSRFNRVEEVEKAAEIILEVIEKQRSCRAF